MLTVPELQALPPQEKKLMIAFLSAINAKQYTQVKELLADVTYRELYAKAAVKVIGHFFVDKQIELFELTMNDPFFSSALQPNRSTKWLIRFS